RLGEGGLTLQRRGLEGFFYETAAEKFFATYRACFAAPLSGKATVLLVNDMHDSNNPGVAKIPEVCDALLRERRFAGRKVLIVPTCEVLHPIHSFAIAKAEEIFVPFKSEHLGSLLEHWVKDLEVPRKKISLVGDQIRK
ncbi:MAG: hypothetical protein AAB250_15920, partial [Bdellovibrionota bacterium]